MDEELKKSFEERTQGLSGVQIGNYKLIISSDLEYLLILDKTKDITEAKPELLSSVKIPENGFTNELRDKVAKELMTFDIIKKKKDAVIFVANAFKPLRKVYNEMLSAKNFKEYQSRQKVEGGENGKFNYGGIKVDHYLENAERFYENQPYFFDKTKIWWIWRDNRWEITDETDMSRLLDDSLGFMGQTVSSTIRSNTLESMRWIGRQNKPEDAPIKWIQFKDKAFSIESKNIYDVTPKYFFCNPIPWDIGESSDTPTMDKLFTEWVGEKYVKTLYEIIAYCCYNDYPIHLIFCLIGCGRNGKSRFLALLSKFLGIENICSTELDSLLDSRFESFKLYKKLACTMGETNFGVMAKTSLLKKLSGQDIIGFEYKNKTPFDDYNYAKIIISSNSLPTSSDTSEGFYRRWLIIDFPNTFPEGKDILKIVPDIEYNNLCKKVVEILPKLLDKGSFTNQGDIKRRKEKYILASNPLSLFIKENCNREENIFMRYSELYTNYVKYLIKNKRRKISRKEFSGVLEEEGLEVIKTSKKIGDDFVNGNFIEGIELKIGEDLIIKTTKGRFIRGDKNFMPCKECGETNSNGWDLQDNDSGEIWCDLCANVL